MKIFTFSSIWRGHVSLRAIQSPQFPMREGRVKKRRLTRYICPAGTWFWLRPATIIGSVVTSISISPYHFWIVFCLHICWASSIGNILIDCYMGIEIFDLVACNDMLFCDTGRFVTHFRSWLSVSTVKRKWNHFHRHLFNSNRRLSQQYTHPQRILVDFFFARTVEWARHIFNSIVIYSTSNRYCFFFRFFCVPINRRRHWKMPNEMITLQLGQCGNQSKFYARWPATNAQYVHFELIIRICCCCCLQLALSFGSDCVWSTAYHRTEHWKSLPPMLVWIAKMCSSIRPMTTITFRGRCCWIWSRVSFTQSWIRHTPNSTIRKMFTYQKMVAELVIIGRPGSVKVNSFKKKCSILLIEKRMAVTVWKVSFCAIRLQAVLGRVWARTLWNDCPIDFPRNLSKRTVCFLIKTK